ncbi:MAG TPA: CvpA family protein [Burkholderiaceae bacterium]|nr:CvpA family protein [Burkholderiaceae bacterium]HPL78009.1 CvpA family protein [Burkholderiaceae bacterium]
MTATDWFLLAVLGASLLLGAWRGLVYELMSMLGWIAAFVLAQWWAPEVALRLPMSGATEPVRYAAAFVLVFVAGAFAGGLLAWITRKLIEAIGLRPVDRTLGAAFGLVRGLVLLLALAVVMDMTPMKSSPWWQTSTGAGLLSTALKGLRPVLPDAFGKYLPA